MTTIILVAPQMGENIGAAARAMKNFGLRELRIVRPRDGWPNKKAEAMAVGAIDIIQSAKIYDDLPSAIGDLEYLYATTAQMRDMNKGCLMSHELAHHYPHDSKVGIMFGRENCGLTNEEISYANTILTIHTDPNFSSLNIAHAVAVICSQLFCARSHPEFISGSYQMQNQVQHDIIHNLSTKAELEYFFEHLFSELDKSRFFRVAEKKPQMKENIRGIFNKIDKLSKNELQTLRGIIAALTE